MGRIEAIFCRYALWASPLPFEVPQGRAEAPFGAALYGSQWFLPSDFFVEVASFIVRFLTSPPSTGCLGGVCARSAYGQSDVLLYRDALLRGSRKTWNEKKANVFSSMRSSFLSVDQTSEASFSRTRSIAIQTSTNARLNWPVLLAGMLLTLVFPASIHVFMLNVMHVPPPDPSHVPQWASSLNNVCSILALAIFYQLARPELVRLSLFRQCLVVSALYAMIRQEILGIVMNGVFTTAYAYSFLAEVPELLYCLLAGCLTVLVVLKVQGLWRKMMGAVLMAGVLGGAVRPVLTRLYAPFLKSISNLDHAPVFRLPLGWHFLIPAYLLTTEVVVACIVVAALAWPRLSADPIVRFLQFALMVMFIKGNVLRFTLYSFYIPSKLSLAFLSESQYFLDWVALSLLTVLTWQVSQRSQS